MDDMKAMMQNELRQALAGLMPPLAPAATIPPTTVAPVANPPVVNAPPANNNNAGGQLLNAAKNVPTMEMRLRVWRTTWLRKLRRNHSN